MDSCMGLGMRRRRKKRGGGPRRTEYLPHLSQARISQLEMIHRDKMKTRRTVPGQMVMRVLRTKRVLKLMRLSAPMLRELASVNSLEWRSMTRKMRYRRRNMGSASTMSSGTGWVERERVLRM